MLDKLKHGTDSLRELFVIYGCGATATAILFSIFEHHNIIKSFWWTFVTGLTIGYGDVYPVTFIGQLIAVVWAHFMVLLLLPLFVGRIVLIAMDNRNEFTHEEQEEILTYIRSRK